MPMIGVLTGVTNRTLAGRLAHARRVTLARRLIVTIGAFSFLSISGFPCFAQGTDRKGPGEGARSHVMVFGGGTWRGNSVCAVENSPCRDESNVYRFAEIAGKPGSFLVTASKIVNGMEIVMGTGEWKYDAAKQTLESETPNGDTLRFKIDGKKMEGSLTLRDGTVYRRISLKKEE
jgi:hypothetical protein